MSISICGINCAECELNSSCGGCAESGGKPFGSSCDVAECCKTKGAESCSACSECGLRAELMTEIKALDIPDMGEITELNTLLGSFINCDYTLPNGQTAKFFDDNGIYLGAQAEKKGSDRCYGVAADKRYILVSEYGEGGKDAEIVVFKRR